MNRKANITRGCSREISRLWQLSTQARQVRDAANGLHEAALDAIEDVSNYLRAARDERHLRRPPAE